MLRFEILGVEVCLVSKSSVTWHVKLWWVDILSSVNIPHMLSIAVRVHLSSRYPVHVVVNFTPRKLLQIFVQKYRVRVKHALRRPRTPSGALTRPQLSQTQNHTPSLGCKTPWGSTRCTPSFRPLPPPIQLRAPFTLKGKSCPQLFFWLKS